MKLRRGAALTALLFLARLVHPQAPGRALPGLLEVTLAYSADRSNGVVGGCGCFWMNGGKAEANVNLLHGTSVVAELAGQHISNINSTNQNLSFVSYLIGPRYSWRNRSKVILFAQFLVGGAHGFDALFPSASQSVPNPDAFAFAPGGGININLSTHFALRGVQADYLQTQLPNGANNRQNHLRLSAGFMLRFGEQGR